MPVGTHSGVSSLERSIVYFVFPVLLHFWRRWLSLRTLHSVEDYSNRLLLCWKTHWFLLVSWLSSYAICSRDRGLLSSGSPGRCFYRYWRRCWLFCVAGSYLPAVCDEVVMEALAVWAALRKVNGLPHGPFSSLCAALSPLLWYFLWRTVPISHSRKCDLR